MVVNEFLAWAPLKSPTDANVTVVVNVTTFIDKNFPSEERDQLLTKQLTDTINVFILGIFDCSEQPTRIDYDEVDKRSTFTNNGTTFGKEFEDWKKKVESRAHNKFAYRDEMAVLEKRYRTRNSANPMSQSKYESHKAWTERKRNGYWQFMHFLNGPARFAKYGVTLIFYSSAPQCPTNILGVTDNLRALAPVQWARSIKGAENDEFLSWSSEKKPIADLILGPIIWITPRIDRNHKLSRETFYTPRKERNEHDEFRRMKTARKEENRPNELGIKQYQDVFQRVSYCNTMSVILISGIDPFPIQEVLMPLPVHFCWRNHTAQIGQPAFNLNFHPQNQFYRFRYVYLILSLNHKNPVKNSEILRLYINFVNMAKIVHYWIWKFSRQNQITSKLAPPDGNIVMKVNTA